MSYSWKQIKYMLIMLMVFLGISCSSWNFNSSASHQDSLSDTVVTSLNRVAAESKSYHWQNIPIAGMGFVTGIVIHPTEPDLIYVRTDVGGIYRWQPDTLSWVQLLDHVPEFHSIESIALDPNRPNVVYAATGFYTRNANGEILKSVDYGKSWSVTPLRTPDGGQVRMGGNEEWRWAGERLAVDPNNSQIVYFGSRLDGLYRSEDGATTWRQVESFPTRGVEGGITFVVFDRNTGQIEHSTSRISQTLYVGVMGNGVYKSQDGGRTWTLLENAPHPNSNPQQAVVTDDGTLYVTLFGTSNASGGVWRYRTGTWTEITPALNQNFSAITSDPDRPNTLMVATYPLTPEGIYRSTDAGETWHRVKLRVNTPAWWPNWHLYTLMGALAINPHNPKQVWLTTGFGVMQTNDITRTPSRWHACMDNLEELVILALKSPPVENGAFLLSGVADISGFRHTSLTEIPHRTLDNSSFGDTTGIDFSEANPNRVVRVGSFPGEGGREDSQGRSAYSDNNGRTWRLFENPPDGAANGKVAVSATLQTNGYPIIVWAPQGDTYPHRSLDGGKTWLPVVGAPNQTTLQLWFSGQPIAADRVNGNQFYLFKYGEPTGGSLYRSIDGGATWERTLTHLPDHWIHKVEAAPRMEGEVWLSVQGHGLYRSSDAGQTMTPIARIQKAVTFSFGQSAPGRSNPTVFVYGTIDQLEGLFRSDDATGLPGTAAEATWIKISTDDYPLSNLTVLEGDRRTFGRVYVGTGGRGILYGQPIPRSQ